MGLLEGCEDRVEMESGEHRLGVGGPSVLKLPTAEGQAAPCVVPSWSQAATFG